MIFQVYWSQTGRVQQLEFQQNSLAANYVGVSTARTALLSAEFVVFLKGLLKLYFHENQDTVDYFAGNGSAQNFQQCNKRNRIVLI